MQILKPAVFLDRDGTIIVEAEYLADPAGVALLPGSGDAIHRLNAAGLAVVVVSNQSGVARGYFAEAIVGQVNARMQELLATEQGVIDGSYYCPHHPQGSVPRYSIVCECRKPLPGMLQQAARELGLDLGLSWVVGDKASDIELGARQGLKSILVLTGYGKKTRLAGFQAGLEPTFIVKDLREAAQVILAKVDSQE